MSDKRIIKIRNTSYYPITVLYNTTLKQQETAEIEASESEIAMLSRDPKLAIMEGTQAPQQNNAELQNLQEVLKTKDAEKVALEQQHQDAQKENENLKKQLELLQKQLAEKQTQATAQEVVQGVAQDPVTARIAARGDKK